MGNIACIERKLTYSIPGDIIRFSLTNIGFEINMENIPVLISCHVTCHSETRSCRSWGISLLIKFLFVLQAFYNPACLASKKLSILVSLYCKDPSILDKVFRWRLSHIHQIINIVVNPGFVFAQFCFKKLLSVLSLFQLSHFFPSSVFRFGFSGT